MRFIENTPPPHAYPSLGSCITWHSLEKLNWRQSIRRLWGLEEGSSSESWLSSQEVLFLTALHKHWKRDAKKGPRLTISTVNTYCTALRSVPLGQHVYFIYASVSKWIRDSGNSFTSANYEYSSLFFWFVFLLILKCFISTAVIKSRAIKQDLLVGETPGVNVLGSEIPSTAAQIYFSVSNKWWRCRSRCVLQPVNKSATARGGTLVSVVLCEYY